MSIRDKTITFGIPMLVPVGWVEFAEKNPNQAELSIGIAQDSDDVMNLLCDVKDDVNEKISPKLDAPEQDWNIWPRSGYGDCTDYTVTKRASRVLVREDADSGEPQLLEVGGRMTHEADSVNMHRCSLLARSVYSRDTSRCPLSRYKRTGQRAAWIVRR